MTKGEFDNYLRRLVLSHPHNEDRIGITSELIEYHESLKSKILDLESHVAELTQSKSCKGCIENNLYEDAPQCIACARKYQDYYKPKKDKQ